MTADLQAFFDAYGRAFEALDAPRIAAFYTVPCMSMRGDGSLHVFRSREEIEAFFRGVAQSYHAEGMRRSQARNLEAAAVGGKSTLATMDWVLYRADGSEIRRWRQSYNLARLGGEWRIMLSTFHVN